MSNIIFSKFPQRAPDDQADELTQIAQVSGLLDILRELEAKLDIMRGYSTEFRKISDVKMGRKDIS